MLSRAKNREELHTSTQTQQTLFAITHRVYTRIIVRAKLF